MTDKKLTDSEIVKAQDILDKWEFFFGQRAGRELWFDKPAEVQDKDIWDFLNDIKLVKDLINRLQAENERLKIECGLAKFDRYKAEFEEFRREIETKAYKEFADKVKDNHFKYFNFIFSKPAFDKLTDKLLQELVGEDNG